MASPRRPRRAAAKPAKARGAKRSRSLRILFVDGPNLNVLGAREPALYGRRTLPEIRAMVAAAARRERVDVEFFQSNHEGEIVDRLQQAAGSVDGIVINPGGFTHTSVAIRDALLYAALPSVEVHLSNPARREPFRKTSLIEDVVDGRIAGFGGYGYLLSLQAILDRLRNGEGRGGK